MKVKNIVVEIKSLEKSLGEFVETYKKIAAGNKVKKKNIISFESVEIMRKVLTPKRIELLGLIRRKKPGSVYELAKMAHRDPKSVNTDVKVLERLGMLESKKTETQREAIIPKVTFDKINVEIPI